jgi:3-hydroxyisobutyrate dehydrogenase
LTQQAEHLPVRDAGTWLVLAPGIGLVFIGVVFVLRPDWGAAIFGVPAPPGSEPYLIAIGLRDIAFGFYILALALFSSRQAVGVVLALTVLIPLGDILIVAHQRGLSAPGHLMLHADGRRPLDASGRFGGTSPPNREERMTTIAFIGLGHMGGPMAANLAKAEHNVVGFDLAAASCDAARETGVAIAGSVREAVANAEAVVTMLPAGKHVLLAVWSDILPAMDPGTLAMDCSTIDVESARKAHAIAQERGCPALDAPVSGGVGGAKAGTLTFMAGGSAEAFAQAEPILAQMGKRVVHCGEAGAGQAAKICNNMILGISMIGVCEAFVLAEKLGLSAQALFDVASTSSGQCWSMTSYCPVPGPVPASPANNGYKPGFAAALMLKDLRLAQEAALAAGAATPLGAEAAQLYALFHGAGHADDDFSGIINYLRGRDPSEMRPQ